MIFDVSFICFDSNSLFEARLLLLRLGLGGEEKLCQVGPRQTPRTSTAARLFRWPQRSVPLRSQGLSLHILTYSYIRIYNRIYSI